MRSSERPSTLIDSQAALLQLSLTTDQLRLSIALPEVRLSISLLTDLPPEPHISHLLEIM